MHWVTIVPLLRPGAKYTTNHISINIFEKIPVEQKRAPNPYTLCFSCILRLFPRLWRVDKRWVCGYNTSQILSYKQHLRFPAHTPFCLLHRQRRETPHEKSQKGKKLYIQAFQEIRSYIIRNQLQPGDLLPTEQTLCQNLGVSRNVLREAIKSMELMGMVQARPGRGTQVQAFSLDFLFQNVLFFHVDGEDKPVREMFGIRKMLELGYMRQAFHALTDRDIAHIRECAAEIRTRWDAGQMFVEADHEFHMALFRPLGNQVLLSLMEAIWAVDSGFELEQKMPHLSSSVNKHDAIVAALENYDYRSFARAMEAHFSSGKYLTSDTYEEYEKEA